MVIRCRFPRAVITVDERLRVGVLLRHGLNLNLPVQIAELGLHIRDTAGADGAFVAIVAPVLEACLVDAVAAAHEHDGIARREHILPANGAVAFGRVLDTAMGFLDLDGHARDAFLAVEEILAEAFAQPADPAVVAVVDAFVGVIVPELAHGTVVECCILAAHPAGLRNGLGRAAQHAEHVACFPAGEDVVFCFVVADSAGIPAFAVAALEFNVALVVGAA